MKMVEDRDLKRGAPLRACGYQVLVKKYPHSSRCYIEYADTPEILELLRAYEAHEILPTPHKNVLAAYVDILAEVRVLKRGGVR